MWNRYAPYPLQAQDSPPFAPLPALLGVQAAARDPGCGQTKVADLPLKAQAMDRSYETEFSAFFHSRILLRHAESFSASVG